MGRKRWLVSWIGNADHEAAEGTRPEHPGPIATALKAADRFDRVVLLTNYPKPRSSKFCKWLAATARYPESSVVLSAVRLDSPIDYAEIYRCVSEQLIGLSLPSDDVDVTFHLVSSGLGPARVARAASGPVVEARD